MFSAYQASGSLKMVYKLTFKHDALDGKPEKTG